MPELQWPTAPQWPTALEWPAVRPAAAGGVFLQWDTIRPPRVQHGLNDPPAVFGGVAADGQRRIRLEYAKQYFTVGRHGARPEFAVQRRTVNGERIPRAVDIEPNIHRVRPESDHYLIRLTTAAETVRQPRRRFERDDGLLIHLFRIALIK